MPGFVRSPISAAVAVLLLLAGCSHEIAAPPVAQAPPPPPAPPAPPPGVSASLRVPPVGADGEYLTLNHGVAPADAVWHVRSALNVAALACRGAEEASIIPAYNALLRAQAPTLAAALRTIEARYRSEQGKGWQAVHDAQMTRLYNFFAQPPAQRRFCPTAAAVLAEAQGIPPADFTAFAVAALPRLERPFTDVYRAYDAYRRDLAAWQARYGPPPAQFAGGASD